MTDARADFESLTALLQPRKAGEVLGLPIYINPLVPPGEVRFVDTVTGECLGMIVDLEKGESE